MSQKSSNFAGEMKIGHKGITFFCKYARKSASFVKNLHFLFIVLRTFSVRFLLHLLRLM